MLLGEEVCRRIAGPTSPNQQPLALRNTEVIDYDDLELRALLETLELQEMDFAIEVELFTTKELAWCRDA